MVDATAYGPKHSLSLTGKKKQASLSKAGPDSLNFEETSTWHHKVQVHVVCPLAHTIPVCRGMKLPSVNSEETSTR